MDENNGIFAEHTVTANKPCARDFLLQQPIEEVNQAIASPKKKAVPQVLYETIYVSGPDFVVTRTTKSRGTKTTWVNFVSAGQTYMKYDSQGGTIEPLSEDNLKKFLKDVPDAGFDIVDENGVSPTWVKTVQRDATWRDAFLGILRSPIKVDLIKNDMYEFDGGSYSVPSYVAANFKSVKQIFNVIADYKGRDVAKHEFSAMRGGDTASILGALFDGRYGRTDDPRNLAFSMISERYGLDGVKQMVQMYLQTPVIRFPDMYMFGCIFWRRLNGRYDVGNRTCPTNFELSSLIDYLFCECTRQGYANDPGGFWSLWADYMDQQIKLFGEVNDKYPETLASSEKITAYRVALNQRKIDQEKFDAIAHQLAKYEYVGQKYRIVAPRSSDDLVEEGRQMSHCVGTYADRVANGDCKIFFMRENKNPDKSLVTIEIRNDGSLGQVRARFNRKPYDEHMSFVSQWYDKFFIQKDMSRTA